ncbi:hypothetical protein AK812_SmicGene37549 [Symbiodinium microadriaticum]|uniref:Uncharacterized protein n=1 Tax=Symbiodinium microadriaticum TaxID=2951 RepID=A0A1Q9CG73_SYMMI|nr:hypothetical protein AK812_SmicGene37549 [Symbiodinium microadriaticum]
MATDLPNPFWSEAVQQEFQRTQQQSETAGDRDATTMREIDETQNEPTYQLDAREQVPPGTVGLAAQGQTVQGEPGSGDHSGERPGHDAVQVHPDVASPAPRSVAGLSEFSNMERGFGMREARVDDRELVPDYAATPAPPGLQSALLTGMGDMMRELLQTQLSEQLAPVFERLGRLESERSSEVSAVSALEPPQRMTLARVEARQTGAQVAVPMSVESGFSSGAVAKAALAGRPDEHAQENQSLGGVVAVAEPTNSENQVEECRQSLSVKMSQQTKESTKRARAVRTQGYILQRSLAVAAAFCPAALAAALPPALTLHLPRRDDDEMTGRRRRDDATRIEAGTDDTMARRRVPVVRTTSVARRRGGASGGETRSLPLTVAAGPSLAATLAAAPIAHAAAQVLTRCFTRGHGGEGNDDGTHNQHSW